MLEDVLLFDSPYNYFLCFDSFASEAAAEMRHVLSSDLDWGVREGSFYVTYRLDLRAFFEGRDTPCFLQEAFLYRLRDRIADIFSAPLAEDIQVLGHRMLPGQQIGIHNDNPGLGFENYRIVTQFTTNHRPEDGGELNIHASDQRQDVYQSIRPFPNMSFGFETSARSYHSVNEVRNQNRDAVLFNFWHAGNSPAVERAILDATDDLRDRVAEGANVKELDSGIEAALVAEGLITRWCLDARVAAAAALCALYAAPPSAAAQSARDALASLLRTALDLPDATEPAREMHRIKSALVQRYPGALERLEALISLAVWVARGPRRTFVAAQWEEAKAQVLPQAAHLPPAARALARAVFGERHES